jgi:hypothetical protein
MKRLPDVFDAQFGPPHDSSITGSFLRGLTAGALIGAAIAGSALLERRRAARTHEPIAPAVPPPAPTLTPAASIDATDAAAETSPSE